KSARLGPSAPAEETVISRSRPLKQGPALRFPRSSPRLSPSPSQERTAGARQNLTASSVSRCTEKENQKAKGKNQKTKIGNPAPAAKAGRRIEASVCRARGIQRI